MSLKSAGPKMLEALKAFIDNVTEEESLDHMAAGCDASVCVLCMAEEAVEEAEKDNVPEGPDGSAFYYGQGSRRRRHENFSRRIH
jgi:hypothetical protein